MFVLTPPRGTLAFSSDDASLLLLYRCFGWCKSPTRFFPFWCKNPIRSFSLCGYPCSAMPRCHPRPRHLPPRRHGHVFFRWFLARGAASLVSWATSRISVTPIVFCLFLSPQGVTPPQTLIPLPVVRAYYFPLPSRPPSGTPPADLHRGQARQTRRASRGLKVAVTGSRPSSPWANSAPGLGRTSGLFTLLHFARRLRDRDHS